MESLMTGTDDAQADTKDREIVSTRVFDADIDLVSAQATEASHKGISGVPTYVFAQQYAVSGAQPPEQLAAAIRQLATETSRQA